MRLTSLFECACGCCGVPGLVRRKQQGGLAGLDQRKLAELSGLSLPTIQRMEASEEMIRGNVDSLMKLVAALDAAGIELIADNAVSSGGGRGVRLKAPAP